MAALRALLSLLVVVLVALGVSAVENSGAAVRMLTFKKHKQPPAAPAKHYVQPAHSKQSYVQHAPAQHTYIQPAPPTKVAYIQPPSKQIAVPHYGKGY